MELEWDEDKRRAVLTARGVDLADSESVLMDDRALTVEQRRGGETRHVTIGKGPTGRLLTVVWTVRGQRLRIVTAWKSNARERKQYEA
ncbi:MAG: BrnT family toxin [Nitrospirota bacterium]|nr:BrnT family toxin [Nitrospirota bacterium]